MLKLCVLLGGVSMPRSIKDGVLVVMFMGGIALAGQDGEWFPWVNIVGFLMFAGFACLCREVAE